MVIEYDGTNFYGWQYQSEKRTVQGEIESALKKITNENVRVIGASRTDQGVHALGQIANFFTSSHLKPYRLRNGINAILADDIYVREIEEINTDFHSRFSAKSKIYQYYIILAPSPFKQRYHWYVKYRIDISAMEEVIPYLLTEHNFKNFSVHDDNESTICNVYELSLTKDKLQIIISIEANRFLRKMVRGIVGFMVDVGRGRFSPDIVKDVFTGRLKEIYFAPPQGLFLVAVRY